MIKEQKRYLPKLVVGIAIVLVTGVIVGCQNQQTSELQEVTFEQLFLTPEKYNGLDILIEGYYLPELKNNRP